LPVETRFGGLELSPSTAQAAGIFRDVIHIANLPRMPRVAGHASQFPPTMSRIQPPD